MMEETKNVIYMTLDLLNSISKTSGSKSGFIDIDENVLKKVRDELFYLMTEKSSTNEEKMQTTKEIKKNVNKKNEDTNRKLEVIGLLPSILIDTEKFPHNSDIAKFAEQSLNLEIPFWQKRSRNEIIGNLIALIAKKADKELDLFYEAWKEFTKKESSHVEKWENVPPDKENEGFKKPNFVGVWLDFFDHYRG